jgi:integrase
MNFTKATLEGILKRHDGQRKMLHDGKQAGLVAELRGAGVITFYLYKRINGPPTKIRLGRFPEMTIDQARQQTIKLLGRIAEGQNPAAERRAARVEHTLGALFDHWLESHAKLHRRTWPEDKRQFDLHLVQLRRRRLSSISRAEVQALHAHIGNASGTVTANRVLSLLKTVFNKSESIGYRGDNPANKVQKFPEQSRDRFLLPDEMPQFWDSLHQEIPLFQDFFMLALLTGARRRNVQAMRWEDVHLRAAIWRIPHTKNDEPVVVHLPAEAVKILRRRQTEFNGFPWVFPSWSTSGHLEEPKTAWKRVINRACLTNLRIHDLRRTLGSWQAIAGTSLQVIGKSLGHKSLQSTQIYSRLTMAPVVESVDNATNAMLAAAQSELKTKRKKVAK